MDRGIDGLTLAAVGDVAPLRPFDTTLYRTGWGAADLRIANLEAPLTEGGIPAPKLIRLKSPPEATAWLRDLGCDAVALANNHIMDWGEPGLNSTLAALDGAGIHYAGAGPDLPRAGTHRLLQAGNWKIAFLSWACTVPPGFLAGSNRPGLAGVRVRTSFAADPMLIDEQPGTPPWVHTDPWHEDVAALEHALGRARAEADCVVLAMHWGVPPQWQTPFQGPIAEYQEALVPRLAEAGADLVLGHHAHTVYGLQAVARAGNSPSLVCFSLGNYIFHPLARGLEIDWLSRPYRVSEPPEHHETYIATFTLASSATDGRLAVREARLHPAILDKDWEARAPTAEQAERIARRVAAFSEWRGTSTTIEDNTVVWKQS